MTHRLDADGIQKRFGTRDVLTGGYVSLETGVVTGLLGRNGCGKSTLLKIVFGCLRGDSQSVRVDGRWVATLHTQPGMAAYLPQHPFMPGGLRVSEAINWVNLEKDAVTEAFPEVTDWLNQPLNQLSGGQRRLVETLLVLLAPVQFALLDEPFSHLAPVQVDRLKEVILGEKTRKGILITDHLHRHVTELSDRLYVIAHERTYLLRSPDELVRWGYLREE